MQALTAPPHRRPSYLAPDLTGLLVPHPEIVRADGGHSCRGWTARRTGGTFALTGSGDPYDGLRALASAAWETEEPPPAEAFTEALEGLPL
jgi:hypothetical protein